MGVPWPVGRESDLSVFERFLGSEAPTSALVLFGDPGIGKTTLWEAGLKAAEARGYLVLSARASEAEVALSFAALADLVDGVDPDVLVSLPAPQRRALEVALRRRDPVGAAPDPFAISAGFLGALRALTDRTPLLIAVDDVQWLDAASADCLWFAVRRLSGGRARFLMTSRSGRETDLERVMGPSGVEQLELAPLSVGATGQVLSQRLGLALRHRVLRQVYETSRGNPLFALELGRMLVADGMPEIGSELPVPEVNDDIFGARVRGLPDPVRRVLLAVALSGGVGRSELSTVVDPLAIEDAIASQLVAVDRSHLRPTHPMLAAAARQQSSAQERHDLHFELASAVGDATLRARHLALATLAPDANRAKIVADAAELAATRGAVHEAEELGAHALRLTSSDAPEHADRVLALGRFHLRADEMTRATDLLIERMDELPVGRARAIAHLLLADAADVPGTGLHAERALAEGGEDPEVRAIALAKKSRGLTLMGVERIDDAEALALEALAAASQVGTEVEDRVRTALAWARVLRGRPIDDVGPSEPLSRRPSSLPESSIERPLGARLTFRGQLEQARVIFGDLLALADERGDVQSSRMAHQQLCELELRAGNVREAARRLDELDQEPFWMGMVRARLRALLGAVTGEPEDAKRWAATVLETVSGYVQGWDRLEAMRAVGLAALFEQDAARAVESLEFVWEHTLREQVGDPGAFPVAADLVEALVRSGDLDSATEVTERLRGLAVSQRHPWGLASARRCEAVVRLAERYADDAAAALGEAASEYAMLGLNFDRGRSLLLLGRVQRRFKKRGAARRSLQESESVFEHSGCSGWAAQARLELARVSGRPTGDHDRLTPSERRVVDLAVRGLSNKEIASRLFVTVYTVEAHLSHAYAKLGIRSRAQLASSLAGSADL